MRRAPRLIDRRRSLGPSLGAPPALVLGLWGALAVGLIAAPGAAQLGDVIPDALRFSLAECGDNERNDIQFEVPLQGQYFWSLRLNEPQPATQDNCPRFGDAPPLHVIVPFDEAEVAPGGEFNYVASHTAAEILGPLCDETPRRGRFPLCLYFSETTNMPMSALDIDARSNAIAIDVDTIAPGSPDITSVVGGDEKLTLTVGGLDASLGDVYEFDIHYRPCQGDADDAGVATDGGTAEEIIEDEESTCDAPGPYRVRQGVDGASIVLSGLENGVTYEVRVVAVDDFGNVGEPSAPETGTPQNELTPLDVYNGGADPFSIAGPDCESCTKGTTTMSFLGLGLLGLLGRRRRRDVGGRARRRPLLRWGFPLWALPLVVLLGAEGASAHVGQLTVGIKGGPYTPAIDTEVAGGNLIYPIYRCFFEDGFLPNGILPNPAVDIDVHVFDKFGSLELGVGLSFTQARGVGAPVGSIGARELTRRTCPTEKGNESVELTIAMAKPQLTYRLDPLWDYFGIPFVPYARVGLVSAVYAFTQNGSFDNGNISTGRNPLGVRFGAEASVGMMFALDWFDLRYIWDLVANRKITPRGQASLLEHTYVFGELTTATIDSFGLPGPVLTPTDRVFGTNLPWTFQIGMAMEIF